MQMIGLSAPVFDPGGCGILSMTADSALAMGGGQRRQTRTATLDGGASLYDTGFTLSDTDWQVKTQASPCNLALVRHLCTSYQTIRASTRHGVVRGSLRSFRREGPHLVFTLSVMEVLS